MLGLHCSTCRLGGSPARALIPVRSHTQRPGAPLNVIKHPTCVTVRPKHCSLISRRPTAIVCRASPTPPSNKLKRSIWTAVDVVALLGSVGGALAALLGVVSPTYALTLPLVLPVVSLIAALQREDITNEEGRAYLSQLSSSLGRDSAALLREAAAAIEEVRREARSQSAAAARLAALEDKLAVLEGAVVGAARNSREAAVGVNALGSALSQTLQQNPAALAQGPMAQQNAHMLAGLVAGEVVPLLQAELSAALGPWLADNSSALKRLDTRLAVVEGSLAGLEVASSDGLSRMSSSISSSLMDAESALQSSVRVELVTAVEPLKQLPQLVAAAAAKAAAAQLQQQQQQQQQLLQQEGMEGTTAAAAAAAGGMSSIDQSLLLQELRELVAAEVAAATQQLMRQQADILTSLAQPPKPTPLPDDQWEALGRRLARLERLVQSVPELGEQAVAGQLAPLVAAQQAAAEAQQSVVTKIGAAAEQLSSGRDQVAAVLREFEEVKGKLEQLTVQLLGSNAPAGGNASAGAEQLVQQMQESVQQMLLQQQQQQQPAGPDLSQLLISLQQQMSGLGAAMQQVQLDIPLQIQLALSQTSEAAAAASAKGGDSFDGAVYDDGSSSSAAAAAAATAASAASAAAQGIAEVRYLLGGVQTACEDLRVQIGTLAAQVAAQQTAALNSGSSSSSQEAAASSSTAEIVLQAAQQQLADTSGQLSRDLTDQLSGLCSSLEQQLQQLQQQLVAAATAAASQAAADAAAAAAAAVAAASSQSDTHKQQQQQQQQPGLEQYSGVGSVVGQQFSSSGGNSTDGSSGGITDQQQQHPSSPAPAAPIEPSYYYDQVTAGGWAGYQQQQQPATIAPEAAAVAAGAAPIEAAAAAAAWSSYGSPEPGVWPDKDVLQQQQQQQQDLAAPRGWVPAAANQPPAGTVPLQQQPVQQPPPSQQQQQQQQQLVPAAAPGYSIPDISGLTEEQLRTEGLRLLRAGREATRGTGSYAAIGPDFAAAESQLQAAVACFSTAVEAEPQDTRALGNLGNALLAQGELKKGLLDELRLSAVQGSLGLGAGGAQSLEGAEMRLRSDASGLLTRAGEIFRRVLEVDGWSSRALVNWGKAMVGRAELAVDRSAATKLYNAAIDKFEAVLEEDPGMVVAKYRCALAMQGLAALNPEPQGGVTGQPAGGLRQRLVLLSDAAAYLSDVVSVGAGGDEGLKEAAAAALRQVQDQLEMAKLAGK